MEPGIYPNLDPEKYHAIPAIGSTILGIADKQTLLHARFAFENGTEDTGAYRAGRVIHCAVLEPDEFANRYYNIGTMRRDKRNAEYQALIAKYGEDGLIKQDENDLAVAMQAALYRKPKIKRLIESATDRELSLVWNDESGVLCKARLDGLATLPNGQKVVLDYKTTQYADNFGAAIWKYRYHMQAAHYLAGCKACGIDVDHYVIVAQEKAAPYESAFGLVPEQALQAARIRREDLLKAWAFCEQKGEFPGYSNELQEWDLPEYAYNAIEAGFID